MLLDFIRHIQDREDFYYWEEDKDFIKYRPYIIGHLFQLQRELERRNDRDAVFSLFQKMILMSREFDLGLVKWLRTMVYNFIDQYSDLKIEDAFEMFLMNDLDKYPTLADYQQNCVAKMGVEAQGLAVYITPVVLRMKLETVIVDKNAANGISKNLYKASLGGKEFYEVESSLNFHECTLSLLLKPGHYDQLYQASFIRHNPEIKSLDEDLDAIYKQLEKNIILSAEDEFIKMTCCGSKFLKDPMRKMILEEFPPPYPQGFFIQTENDKKHASCLNPQCQRLLLYADISQVFKGFLEEQYIKARNKYQGFEDIISGSPSQLKKQDSTLPKFEMPTKEEKPYEVKEQLKASQVRDNGKNKENQLHCLHQITQTQLKSLQNILSLQQLKQWERCRSCNAPFSYVDYQKFLTFLPKRFQMSKIKFCLMNQNAQNISENQLTQSLANLPNTNLSSKTISGLSASQRQGAISMTHSINLHAFSLAKAQISNPDREQKKTSLQSLTHPALLYGCKCENGKHEIKQTFLNKIKSSQYPDQWPRCLMCNTILTPNQIANTTKLVSQDEIKEYQVNQFVGKAKLENSTCQHQSPESKIVFQQIYSFLKMKGSISKDCKDFQLKAGQGVKNAKTTMILKQLEQYIPGSPKSDSTLNIKRLIRIKEIQSKKLRMNKMWKINIQKSQKFQKQKEIQVLNSSLLQNSFSLINQIAIARKSKGLNNSIISVLKLLFLRRKKRKTC